MSKPRVFLCSIDGARPDAIRQARTPVISRLAREGAHTWNARTVLPSVTLPCHSSMLRGVEPARHGITSNTFHPLARPVPSLIDVAHIHGKQAGFFYNWEELRDLASPGTLAVSLMGRAHDFCEGDDYVTEHAILSLERYDLDLLFLYLGGTDECGHKFGWMSDEYLNTDRRREKLRALLADVPSQAVVTSDLGEALAARGVRPAVSAPEASLRCIRRRLDDGCAHFLVNEGADAFDGWIALDDLNAAVIMDPMMGETGFAQVRHAEDGSRIRVQIAPEASLFVKTSAGTIASSAPWPYRRPCGAPIALEGIWTVDFIDGGPDLPPSVKVAGLSSWTEFSPEAERFAGTARYTMDFDAPPAEADEWWLDLGTVRDSARVRLNGTEIGTLIVEPFRIRLGSLQAHGNRLVVEVTNLAANRIRDLDRRGERWKVFKDINIVDRHYKPFDASGWPVRDSGLLGPVRLIPMAFDPPQTTTTPRT